MSWHTWDTVSDGRAQPGSPITVVARKRDHLDLFATDEAGRVKTTWWDAAEDGWADWHDVEAGQAQPGSLVSAVAPDPDLLNIFVTGTRGPIYTSRWGYDPHVWYEPWVRVSDGQAQPGSPISVVARKRDHLDLFATGKDGRVKTTWGP